MEHSIRLLEELRSLGLGTFRADQHHYLFAERCFQRATQCLPDACFYIAACKGRRPEGEAEAIELIASQRVTLVEGHSAGGHVATARDIGGHGGGCSCRA
jgi:uncharacterized protein YutE (UPF0331/DUF86 family)